MEDAVWRDVWNDNLTNAFDLVTFKALFGLGLVEVECVWSVIIAYFFVTGQTLTFRRIQLLWSLNFLKSYENSRTIYKKFKRCSRRTFDKYLLLVLDVIENCLDEVICFFLLCIYFVYV
jgi:hypothetical protein